LFCTICENSIIPSRPVKLAQHGRAKKGGLVLILIFEVAGPPFLNVLISPDLCSSSCGHHPSAQLHQARDLPQIFSMVYRDSLDETEKDLFPCRFEGKA
jgi:hypothetical protein